MARRIEELTSEVLSLAPERRAELAVVLLDSLETLSEQEIERLWADEAEARYTDIEAGRARTISGDEVFARSRARKP